MKARNIIAVMAGLAVCMAGRSRVLADWWDNFDDGVVYEPSFHIDDPCWTKYTIAAGSQLVGVWNGRLRITVTPSMFPFCFGGMSVEDGLLDPNTCYYTNTTPHYLLANMRSHDDNWEPNTGMEGVWIHGDFLTNWTAFDYQYEPMDGWMSISSYSGFMWIDMVDVGVGEPGYPPDLLDSNRPDGRKDNRIPHWMLIQYDPNGTHYDPNRPNDPNDPNCHWLRGAAWTGDKYKWDGTWSLQTNIIAGFLGHHVTDPLGDDFPFDPNLHMDLFFHPAGYDAVAAFGGGDSGLNVDVSYDDFESRHGYFSNVPRMLDLTVNHSNWGDVMVDPNLVDPNNPALRRYTNGTAVVLVATPISGKSFKEWTIYDPNYPGDISHAASDSNAVLHLTMNADWKVDANFKCGSGMEPFVAVALLALAVGAGVRRWG